MWRILPVDKILVTAGYNMHDVSGFENAIAKQENEKSKVYKFLAICVPKRSKITPLNNIAAQPRVVENANTNSKPGMWKRKLEAVEVVKFLWKRKHFEERSWKRKRTRKHLTF